MTSLQRQAGHLQRAQRMQSRPPRFSPDRYLMEQIPTMVAPSWITLKVCSRT